MLTMILTLLKKMFNSPVDKLKEEIIAMVNSLPGDGKKPEQIDPTANNELMKKYIEDMVQYPIKACWMKLIPLIVCEENINIINELFENKKKEVEMLEDRLYQSTSSFVNKTLTYFQYSFFKKEMKKYNSRSSEIVLPVFYKALQI
jgi:hypothetical protein